jgi:hypothetical protein
MIYTPNQPQSWYIILLESKVRDLNACGPKHPIIQHISNISPQGSSKNASHQRCHSSLGFIPMQRLASCPVKGSTSSRPCSLLAAKSPGGKRLGGGTKLNSPIGPMKKCMKKGWGVKTSRVEFPKFASVSVAYIP